MAEQEGPIARAVHPRGAEVVERGHAAVVEGTFVLRRNRFAADVVVGGAPALAHVPNTGRMRELLVPGAPVWLRPAPAGSARRTAFDLIAIHHRGIWVGLDSRVTPGVVVEAWRRGLLPGLSGYERVRREVRFGESRLDLLFEGAQGQAYVEAKSVNLVVDGIALFPDAPTPRGVRHLGELVRAVREGDRAAAAFVIQRNDAAALAPFEAADPAFADALRRAAEAGVDLYAICCTVGPGGLSPVRTVPVRTSGIGLPAAVAP
ncbi:MAG: DNA/RNA nuclease SfsA [Chloroflexi bacterium]|nr:DNA/RNA nuclease SfsA [Chloroflexota bacterium]